MGQVRRQPNRRVHCDQVKTEGAPPAGCGAEPCCFFPAWDHASEAGVIPCRFFPFTFPWTKSMGLNSFNCPGSRTQESYGGLRPQTPMKIKRFKPSLLSAFREQQRGKEKRERMGAIRPQTPNQEQCPWTPSAGTSHVRHDGTWAVTYQQP